MIINITAGFPGRDETSLDGEVENGKIVRATLRGIGCPEFLQQLAAIRPNLVGRIDSIVTPKGNEHSQIILRELVLKLKGQWDFPYKEEELCHCRQIPCNRVDQAIVFGAQTVQEVANLTFAGTGCGTCRKNTEEIIKYRRKSS